MANLNKTKLDASQCSVDAFDGVEEAHRVIIAAATEFGIQLDATDGDSVLAYPVISAASVSAAQTPATANGTVLLTVSLNDKYSKLQVYTEALTGVTALGKVLVQASPNTVGNLWADIGSEISSPALPGIAASPVVEFIARRIRIVSSSAPVGGNIQHTIILKN